jgi:hypothetical protein
MSIKTYSELITLPTFEERYRYLRIGGSVGKETFGFDRYLNQKFYSSYEWRQFRRDVIIRDMGCDLGIEDRAIQGLIIIHHLNSIDPKDIQDKNIRVLLDFENVICVSHNTHNAIHYGDDSLLFTDPIIRTKNDTCPWKR